MFWLIYLLLLIALIRIYFMISRRFGFLDRPVQRSSHENPVIRGAGILFPAGLVLWFAWAGFPYPWFFAGLLLLSLTSFIDDLSHRIRWIRFIMQIAVIPLIVPEIAPADLSIWEVALLLVLGTGILNAFNFMDGINGMMGIYSLVTLASLWVVNQFITPFIENDLLYAAAIPVLIFGFYNFRGQARCFAGDVGPAAVAYLFVFLVAKLILASGNILYLWFLLVFGIDSLMTIATRIRRRENILHPHRRHLYQLLANEARIPQLLVAGGYALVQLTVNTLVVVAAGKLTPTLGLVMGFLLIVVTMAAWLQAERRLKPGDN